jgi:hypothetical protein
MLVVGMFFIFAIAGLYSGSGVEARSSSDSKQLLLSLLSLPTSTYVRGSCSARMDCVVAFDYNRPLGSG